MSGGAVCPPQTTTYLIAGAVVFAFILFLSEASHWSDRGKNYNVPFRRQIVALAEQAANKGIASAQDGNPINSLKDAVEALTYLKVAREMLPNSQELGNVLQVDPDDFVATLRNQESAAIRRVLDAAPSLEPQQPYVNASTWA